VDPNKYTELLHLWRGKENSGLFVETSGHLLASSEPLNDKQRKRFIDLIKELADWLNIPKETFSENLADSKLINVEPAIVPPPVQPASFVSQTEEVELNSGENLKTSQVSPPPPIPESINRAGHVSITPPLPTYNPPPKPAPKIVGEAAPKAKGSMVEQIDDILQEVIQNSDKPDRKIRLVEELKEGVIVWVGNDHYVGIDLVPDPIVKDLIRAAVKEWDRRTESHL
jgi:hypothetical protein